MSRIECRPRFEEVFGLGCLVLLLLAGDLPSQGPDSADQPRPARFYPVDLQAVANQKRKDSFHSGTRPDNTLESLSTGEHRLLGVLFRVGESLLQLGSTSLPDKPAKITGIKVGKKLAHLHFLHATAYSIEEEVPIGSYTVHYADGTSATIPIINGKDVADWWKYPFSKAPTNGKVAWEGTNPAAAKEFNASLWLFSITWPNPKPDISVTSIDFASTMDTACAPFCVAITGAEPLKAPVLAAPLAAKDLADLWDKLAGNDVEKVSTAVETLAGGAREAVPFLNERLRAVKPGEEEEKIAKLITQLYDDSLKVREKALEDLEKLGPVVVPQLQFTLEKTGMTLAFRLRVVNLLEKIKVPELTAEQKRWQWAIAALELAATAEARKALGELAQGSAGAWLGAGAKRAFL